LSFSQEKNIGKNLNDNYSFSQFNKNIKSTSNFNFNKNNSNRAQKYRMYDKMDNNYKLNKIDVINTKFVLKSQKIEKPIMIKKEQNQANKILPLLNDKINLLNNSSASKNSNLINIPPEILKIQKLKKTVKKLNKSHFSFDKIKIRKKGIKKSNSKKDTDIIKTEKYMKTFFVNMKTSLTKEKKQDKNNSPLLSSNNLSSNKKRGISSHSTNLIKRKKFKIKPKSKIHINRSSSNLIESFTDLKNGLKDKSNFDNIFLSNRIKIYDYLITKYKYNNQNSINNNKNIEDTDNNINNNKI
jgi:hypothetical protein